MIPRYTTPEMADLWSDAHRFETWTRVELAATRAREDLGRVPAGTTDELVRRAAGIDWAKFATRALEIEETTRHDVIAFLSALEEVLGDGSRYVHYGMTSSDVVDTSFACLLVESGEQLLKRLDAMLDAMREQAEKHRDTMCLGRTHGQAAEPTTFGLKLLGYVAELDRARRRLAEGVREVAHAKLSGAVGNYGNFDPEVERVALLSLGLFVEPVSTQVVPRDRHATFFSVLAIIGGLVERFAVEIRHLMRTEVGEAFEPFGKGQRGSSAMPHKKNPILMENVTGLARLLRSYAMAAMENQALWHERDISHSSVERVIAPDATIALDFALKRTLGVVSGLDVDANAMQRHVDATGGLVYSEAVLLALVDTGVLRQEAYGWVQAAALEAREGKGSFQERLGEQAEIKARVDATAIATLFDPKHHLRHVGAIYTRVYAALEEPMPTWRSVQ